MDNLENLRAKLVSYIRKKFYTRHNTTGAAGGIVKRAFLDAICLAEFFVRLQ
ncbi:MAG: hypothetical protein FWH16_00610 [Oscillospiraceae bacterium]|nr:hypothetical protein [Oscillospiraceae bacterium]